MKRYEITEEILHGCGWVFPAGQRVREPRRSIKSDLSKYGLVRVEIQGGEHNRRIVYIPACYVRVISPLEQLAEMAE